MSCYKLVFYILKKTLKGLFLCSNFFSMSMFEHAKKNERVRNFDIEGDKKKWEMSIIIEIEEWKNKILEKEEGKKMKKGEV